MFNEADKKRTTVARGKATLLTITSNNINNTTTHVPAPLLASPNNALLLLLQV